MRVTPELQKPSRKFNSGDLLHFIQILAALAAIVMAWQYRADKIAANTEKIAKLEPDVEEMKRNGHADHERRIKRLEDEKANKEAIAGAIELQSKNIDKLAETVKTDHDSIVRLTERIQK